MRAKFMRELEASNISEPKDTDRRVRVPRSPQSGLTEEALGALVEKTCAGDDAAWQALWPEVARVVEKAVTPFRVLSRLAESADERSDVVVHVMWELRRNDSRRLGELGERLAQRDGSWARWLSTVATNAGLNHVRDHAEYLGEVEGGGVRWASHTELSEAHEDAHADPLRRVEAHAILAWAREHLPAPQFDAFVAWLHGAGSDEETDAEARLVRAAVQRLRREFAVERDSSVPPCPAPRSRSRRGNAG